MGSLILLVLIVVVLAAAAAVLKGKGKGEEAGDGSVGEVAGPLPYRRRDWLLTKGEAAFYHVLREAVEDGGKRRVFAKVRLIDLVWLPRGTERAQSWKNRVMSKHIDFVVCEMEGGLRPVVAIELDDASHEREDRKGRDEFVEGVCRAAGLRLERVRAAGTYDVVAVRGSLLGDQRVHS